MPLFEFDAAKSQANKAKHGIDFEEAQELWRDDSGALIDAKSDLELRSALIASLRGKVWTAIFTVRVGVIRLISVRRARPSEAKIYEENND